MSTQVNIRLDIQRGFDKLWARAPQIVEDEMLRAVTEADLVVKSELQTQLPKGAGALRGGAGLAASVFNEERVGDGGFLGVVATNLGYAEPVELGTRPHMPPVQPIEDWVTARLNVDGKAARAIAWRIAQTIKARGTKGKFTWQRVAQQVRDEVTRKFAEALNRVLDRMGAV